MPNHRIRTIDFGDIQLLRRKGIFIPMDGKICTNCRLHKAGPILVQIQNEPVTPQTPSTLGLGEHEPTAPGMDTTGSPWDPPSQEVRTEKLELLNKLMQLDNTHVQASSVLHQSINDIGKTRRWEVKKCLGAATAAVIHTLSSNREEDGMIWSLMKEGKFVERFLASGSPPGAIITDIIVAHNNATDYRAKIQILR